MLGTFSNRKKPEMTEQELRLVKAVLETLSNQGLTFQEADKILGLTGDCLQYQSKFVDFKITDL